MAEKDRVKQDGNGRPPAAAQAQLRALPGVDALLRTAEGEALLARYGHALTVEAVRAVLEESRAAILAGVTESPSAETILAAGGDWLADLLAPTLRPVINATGVIVHTNLGRAPLSDDALAASAGVATCYSTLEYELTAGRRGSRTVHAEALLTRLTGAEAALVVNNNAAAVLLMLTALCRGREVIISRGQLVEIGGGFRVPDVMAQSGAGLVEVGTTNRTHLRDYAAAITEQTAAILVAHHSNYKIVGFTSEPTLAELAELAREHHLPLLYDQGSGALLDPAPYGLEPEPTVPDGLAAGADVIAFSGDKLLGGPQAGILCGRRELIQKLKAHPLARAVRADKLALAALAATLNHYHKEEAEDKVPVWQMISRSHTDLDAQANRWLEQLLAAGVPAAVDDGFSTVGGGSLPGSTLPTRLVAIQAAQVDALAARLRSAATPVIGRIAEERLLLDPRTVLSGQDEALLTAVVEAFRGK